MTFTLRCRQDSLWLRGWVATIGLLLGLCGGGRIAQAQELPSHYVDIFCGAELNYRDITHRRVYDVLINLTPGAKWYMPHHWQAGMQWYVPVLNQYGEYYKRVRLNVLTLSKEWFPGQKWAIKASGGLFSRERYGLDVKAMYCVNSWLALRAQAGLTGFCSMATGWNASPIGRLTGTAEADLYLSRWNTEFRIRGGRYIYEDYGGTLEIMRHFTHCTVGIFGEYGNLWKSNAGFKVVMMIPPYRRKIRTVNVRPASNFRLTNNFAAEMYAMKMYNTDPEENEREGWFDRRKMEWGVNRMTKDFELKKVEKKIQHEK